MLTNLFDVVGKPGHGLARHELAISRTDYIVVYAENYKAAMLKAGPYFLAR